MKKLLPLAALLVFPQFARAVSADDAPFSDFTVPTEKGGQDAEMTDVEKEIEAEMAKDKQSPAAKPQAAAKAAPTASAPRATAPVATPPASPDDAPPPTFDSESQAADAGAKSADAATSADNLDLDKSLEAELNKGDSNQAASPKAENAPPAETQTADQPGAESDDAGLLSQGLEAPVTNGKSADGNLSAVDVLEAQLDNKDIFGSDGGDMQRNLQRLTPSEIFARIPLRTPMSDKNWSKWAGPMVEKNYSVRKRDTLWSVSTRLFGTPYLWPKIWHLNATVTNPNIIEAKTLLSFSPANPNSAPELAYTPNPNDPLAMILPAMNGNENKPVTLMEMVDQTLRNSLRSGAPRFLEFLVEKKPRIYGKLPKVDFEGKEFYSKGDQFKLDVDDGNYNVVTIDDYSDDLFSAYEMRWRGSLRVHRKLAKITSVYFELMEGQELVKRNFALSPLAIHEATLGPIVAKHTKLVPVSENAQLIVSPNQVVGVRFPYSDSGPRPGAVLTFDLGMQRTGKAVLLDRDQRVGTLWVLSADREVTMDDKIF